MDFTLNEEQRALQETARRFARDELSEVAREIETNDEPLSLDWRRRYAEMGFLGINMDAEYGGHGLGGLEAILVVEAFAEISPALAFPIFESCVGPVRAIEHFAGEALKRRVIPKVCAGETVVAVAMSEPEAGSALTDLATTATPDGDGFRIDGTKVFTTHSPYANLFLIYVRYGPGVAGIGSVLVERDTEGLSFGRPSRYLSGEVWRQLYFENCYVGPENVLLPAGGFQRQMAGFNAERIGNSARSLAVGRLAFNIARDYAKTRIQFGRPLAEFQGLQWKFADMAMWIEAAQLLLYRAAVNADAGLPSAHETALAKAYCNIVGFEAANESLQVMGGIGYSEETLVDYCMRRARGWLIAGGSLEMMKTRIAEGIFERRFSQRPPK